MKNEHLPIVDQSFCDILELLFAPDFYRNWNPKNYPPYNIIRIPDKDSKSIDGDIYRIDVAVAGFGHDDITVDCDTHGTLCISGAKIRKKLEESGCEVIHRGISSRAFQLKFKMSNGVVILKDDVTLSDGILSVSMKKPIQTEIKIKKK